MPELLKSLCLNSVLHSYRLGSCGYCCGGSLPKIEEAGKKTFTSNLTNNSYSFNQWISRSHWCLTALPTPLKTIHLIMTTGIKKAAMAKSYRDLIACFFPMVATRLSLTLWVAIPDMLLKSDTKERPISSNKNLWIPSLLERINSDWNVWYMLEIQLYKISANLDI